MKLVVERMGQPYVDELVRLHASETPCARAVRRIFGRRGLPPIVVGFDRVPLVWLHGSVREEAK